MDLNPLKALMKNLAKAAHKKGLPWNCPQCSAVVESKGKTLDQFTDACLAHAQSHRGPVSKP